MADVENDPEHAARAARAVAVAAAIAAEHGVTSPDPALLGGTFARRVHLRPAPIVARVTALGPSLRRPPGAWLARELDVARFLAARGAPVVPPSDLLPPGPHERDGFGVTFWRYLPPAPGAPPPGAVVGALLADLHAALRGYPGDVPLLGPPLGDIPRALERLGRPGAALPRADVARLRRAYESVLLRLKPGALGPLQPLHGDPHPGNLVAAGGDWLWRDFADACLGPVAYDLAALDDGDALAAYPGAPDAEALALAREVRRVHALARGYALAAEAPSALPRLAPLLERLRRDA